jgi:hypothetical protein
LGFAILGQKQYPSALVRYLASARADVFQCSFLLLSSSSVFQSAVVPGGRNSISPPSPSPVRYVPFYSDTLKTLKKRQTETKNNFKTKVFIIDAFTEEAFKGNPAGVC